MTGKLENLKRILAIGPATLVSVAYIDPGNFGTNIEAGSKYGLTLLWVIWLSGAMAIMFQYISGKVGIVTEKGLLDVSMAKLRKNEKKLYFFGLFIAILATDMAEFVGMAVGFHLILGIPLSISAGLSVVDVLLLFLLTEDLGRMEIVIAGLVGIVGLSYLIELVIVHANPEEILMHSFIPYLSGSEMILTATSIIGATIMPHAIILHSYLSAEKSAGKGGINKKGEIKNHLKETLVNLGGASLVNAAIQIMSYYAFYLKGLTNITSLESAYYTLAPLFGALASWIFAISLFSSGLSSSMVSVIAGVKILESYFGTPTKQWKVRLMLRLINMVPFLIAVYLGVDMMSILVYTQAILSFSLPLVLFPLINISKDGNLMGGYKISKPLYVISLVSTVFIVLINIAMFVF